MDHIIIEDKRFNLNASQKKKIIKSIILNIYKGMISNYESTGLEASFALISQLVQDILSSYHNVNSSLIDGIKRYKNLTESTIKNHNTSCVIYLNNNGINPYRIIYTIFNDFFKCFRYFSINGICKLCIKIDNIKMKQYKLSLIELFNIVKSKVCELYTFVDIILLPEFLYTIIIILDDIKEINAIKNIYICGIEKILDIKTFHNKSYFLTIGSNLSYLLAHKDVNEIRTISNNIDDVYLTLGIEIARKIFIQELSNLLNLSLDNPCVLLIADIVTIKGVFLPINSTGLSKMLPSLLVNMANEKIKNNMKSSIPFGSKVFNENISEQTITGSIINIGTGAMDLYRTCFIRIITYPEDSNNINIYTNKLIIKNKKEIIFDIVPYIGFNNVFIKKSEFEYIKKKKYCNLEIIVTSFSVLDLIVNDTIDIKVSNSNVYIKIPLISFNNKNIFDTNISYKTNASNCYYNVSISNSCLELLDKKIVSNVCGTIIIKKINSVDSEIFENIVIILEPSDNKLAKINVKN